PGTAGFPGLDPWGDEVRGGGQYAYRSKSGGFIRVRPSMGKSNVLREARIRLGQRSTKPLVRLVVNVDVDTSSAAGTAVTGLTGLRQQDLLHQVQQIDPQASVNAVGEIELDGGSTRVSLVRWYASDPPAPGLPDQQALERLVSAALAAAYPARA